MLQTQERIHAGRLGGMFDLKLRANSGHSLSLDEMRTRLPAIFAEGAHESRSERYVFISTANMITALGNNGFLPVEARVSRSRIAGKQAFTKHMLRFRRDEDLATNSERRVGDTTFEVILRNAHDGTGSYLFMAGLLKLLCLNGLVASDGTVSNVKVLHSGNRDRQMGQVIEGAYTVLDQGPKVLDTVRRWQDMQLLPDERLALADAARTVRFGDAEGKVATPITAQQLLNVRRPQEVGKTDLWSTFNIVQENTIRGGLSATGRDAQGRIRRSTSREVRGIDGDMKLNRALWQLAERMAELKS